MRIALVAGPDPGHLLPVAAPGRPLRAAGHETVVCTSPRWAEPLTAAGQGFLALPLPAVDADVSFGDRLANRPAQMAPLLAAALQSFAPDLVVADTLTRAGALAAGLLAVPWVELIPHNLTDPSRVLPPFGTGWSPNPLRDRLLRAMAERSFAAADGNGRRPAPLPGCSIRRPPCGWWRRCPRWNRPGRTGRPGRTSSDRWVGKPRPES